MLHSDFLKHIEEICSKTEGQKSILRAYESISGGDINRAYRFAMTRMDYFIKINTSDKLDLFEKEARGLQLLGATQSFVIPPVIDVGIYKENSYLLLSFENSLDAGRNPKAFAENLASLHRTTQEYFGLDYNNYIGSLAQINTPETDWTSFYIKNRLQYQVDLAKQKNLIPVEILNRFDTFYNRLYQILPQESPSLLHGDLWSGNYFYNPQGKPILFDPAVYFGNREVDLAMMRLFGGFDDEIYNVYNEIFPLKNDWQERIKIYQLYPLLVHLNLFGASYLSYIKAIINAY